MKNSILTISVILMISYLMSGCSSIPQASPTVEPTQVQTKTSMPEPTSTDTPSPTSAPTATPTLAFYSVDPTIVTTAESCSALPSEICVSGSTIKLSGRKLAKYKVDVSSPGFPGTTSFDCPQKALLVSFGDNMAPVICDSSHITFVTVGLTEITLTINWEGGSLTKTLHPAFEISAPQGPECNPQCSVGNAEINIP